jgi:hypothetical protein
MTRAAQTVDEFCDDNRISRATFYELLKNGNGPRTFKVGRRTLISADAAAEWRARLESETAS